MTEIVAVQGDITEIEADAIVNAANATLLGGGGVDGAIHRAAGPRLLAECRGLGGCRTGEAKITKGYDLAARHVIHTVGPVWYGGKGGEHALLRNCYLNSLGLAERHGLKSIAFPAISTGAYGYPIEEAADVAIAAAREYTSRPTSIEKIIFVLFSRSDLEVYRKALKR